MTTQLTNPRTRAVPRLQIFFEGPGRTKQAHKDECDINIMMAKYQKTGQMPAANPFRPIYGDFSHIDDYQAAVNQVHEAQESFADLPSQIRSRFRNDPAELLRFMEDPANTEEAIQLGLLPEPENKKPAATPKPESEGKTPEGGDKPA